MHLVRAGGAAPVDPTALEDRLAAASSLRVNLIAGWPAQEAVAAAQGEVPDADSTVYLVDVGGNRPEEQSLLELPPPPAAAGGSFVPDGHREQRTYSSLRVVALVDLAGPSVSTERQ